MRTVRKLVALVMGILLLASLLIACGGSSSNSVDTSSNEGTSQSSTGNGDAQMPELPNNTLTLTIDTYSYDTEVTDTIIFKEWQRRMEEYLGVTLDITWNRTPWQDYAEREKLLIQSGDLADISAYMSRNYVNRYGGEGLVLDLTEYWDYMTYYPKYVDATNGGIDYITTEDGASYFFSDGLRNDDDITGSNSFISFAYRFDTLRELGLTPATTLDEFTQLCATIQAGIDDGSLGGNYVIQAATSRHPFYRGFAGIFHTANDLYWNGTKWAFGPIDDNFRDMLAYMNELWEAGYIDPEFATDTDDLCQTKAANNNAYVIPTLWAGYTSYYNDGTSIEGLEWGNAYLPSNPEYGKAWKWGSKQTGYSLDDSYGIIINANTEYPEWCVKLIDYQYSDEMVDLVNWGIEDQHWERGEDGRRHYTTTITDSRDPRQTATEIGIQTPALVRQGVVFMPQDYSAMIELELPSPWWGEKEGYYEGVFYAEGSNQGGPESVSPQSRPPVVRLNADELTVKSELEHGGAVELYAREMGVLFITGAMDVNDDQVWTDYIAGVKSQTMDFDGFIETINEKTVPGSSSYGK